MYLIKLIINNYKLIEHADLSFEECSYLVVGVNLDESSADSNGVGKTSLLDSIFWCLFGASLENCKADDVIPFKKDETNVSLVMSHNGKTAKIERTRRRSGGHEVAFVVYDENGEGTIIRDTSTKLKPLIFDFLFPDRIMSENREGSDIFSHIVHLSGDRLDSFSSKYVSPSERMAIVYSLFDNRANLRLSEIESIFKDKNKEIDGKLSYLKNSVLSPLDKRKLEAEITISAGKLEEAKNDVSTKSTHLEKLQARIEKINFSIKDKQDKIELTLKKIRDTESNVNVIDGLLGDILRNNNTLAGRINSSKERIETLSEKLEEQQNKRDAIQLPNREEVLHLYEASIAEKAAVEADLTNLNAASSYEWNRFGSYKEQPAVECPNCKEPLIVYSDGVIKASDVAKIREQIKELSDKYDLVKRRLYSLETSKKVIAEYDLLNSQINTTSCDLSQEEELLHTLEKGDDFVDPIPLENDLLNLKANLQTWKKSLEELYKQAFTEDRQKLQVEINSLITTLRSIEIEIPVQEAKLELLREKLKSHNNIEEQVILGLSYQGICSDWLNLIKTYKQDRLLQLLSEFEQLSDDIFHTLYGGNLEFNFENLGEPSAKFLINVKLSSEIEFRPINTLSSGEARRCGFATILAARQIIGSKQTSFGLLMVDEALDKLDLSGRESIVNYLLEKGGQQFIVSHTDDVAEKFANKIVITKSGGTSTAEIR